AYFFAPEMTGIFVQTTDAGRDKLYRFSLPRPGAPAPATGTPQLLVGDHNSTAFALSRDGRVLVWVRDAADHPAEVWIGDVTATAPVPSRALTHENDGLVGQVAVNPAEDFWFT